MLYISIELQLIFLCYSELQTVYEVMGLGSPFVTCFITDLNHPLLHCGGRLIKLLYQTSKLLTQPGKKPYWYV